MTMTEIARQQTTRVRSFLASIFDSDPKGWLGG